MHLGLPARIPAGPLRAAAAALLLAITGCGAASDAPGLDQARDRIIAALQRGTDNGAELVSLSQTDAVSGEMMGVPFRSIEFAGTLKALETRHLHLGGGFVQGCSFSPERRPAAGCKREIPRALEAGRMYAFTGKIDFTKKDSGWVPDDKPSFKTLSEPASEAGQ